eukprot:CAMPEP_0194130546 /NCGR_PEP_ID=MMETSP0152-20130528/1578_1 /TAXON_ID=1049557 /ORGANISM="Thalassiothrix antarctica, Strain L6-D1" /LENGTH=162 /DNA_ID=CAMNT_0038825109 /DNA_START=182 /DNA_END=670 /DNA_ORIENTATION=+
MTVIVRLVGKSGAVEERIIFETNTLRRHGGERMSSDESNNIDILQQVLQLHQEKVLNETMTTIEQEETKETNFMSQVHQDDNNFVYVSENSFIHSKQQQYGNSNDHEFLADEKLSIQNNSLSNDDENKEKTMELEDHQSSLQYFSNVENQNKPSESSKLEYN